jgi:hypothetical protein
LVLVTGVDDWDRSDDLFGRGLLSEFSALTLGSGSGVRDLDVRPGPSPSLTKVSTAFSTLPLTPFNTMALRFSSGNPISFRDASLSPNPKLESPMLCVDPPTVAPNTLDCLLTFEGDGDLHRLSAGSGGGSLSNRTGPLTGYVDDAARNANLGPFFGGRGGGSSELVLPVLCRVVDRALPPENARCSYFCRMNLSIVESTSSTSIGIDGFAFCGLNSRFEVMLPIRFIVF